MNSCEWIGKEDAIDGVGIFVVNNRSYKIPLSEFKHFLRIREMFEKSYWDGANHAISCLEESIHNSITSISSIMGVFPLKYEENEK